MGTKGWLSHGPPCHTAPQPTSCLKCNPCCSRCGTCLAEAASRANLPQSKVWGCGQTSIGGGGLTHTAGSAKRKRQCTSPATWLLPGAAPGALLTLHVQLFGLGHQGHEVTGGVHCGAEAMQPSLPGSLGSRVLQKVI